MKKFIYAFLPIFLLTSATSAEAQMLFGRQPSTSSAKVESTSQDITESQATETKALPEESAPQVETKGIQVELTEEQKEEADENLRNNLRNTTKRDELKTRVEFLEANDYHDEIMLRRKLMKNGEKFKLSSRSAKAKPKANVNPKSDSQMDNYLLERAGVAEKQKSHE
ncbi:MAG: hypothetical protein IKK52_01120 [Alphaproteobacteria bacterium]|nr:hypothetical protein [Alphaproteobacteria bacterium]